MRALTGCAHAGYAALHVRDMLSHGDSNPLHITCITLPVDMPRLVCYNPCMFPFPSRAPRCRNTLHPKAAWCAGVPRYGLELTQGTWQLVPATERATHCRVCREVEVQHRNAQLAALRAQRPRPA